MATESEVPVAAEPAVPVATESEVPVAAEPAVPVAAEPAVPVAAEPAVPVAAESEVPVAAEPAVPVAAESEVPVAAEPTEPVRRSWLGIWALVLAILGLGPIPLVGSVLGIVLGRLALRRVPASSVVGGRSVALIAFWLGTTVLAVIVIAVTTYSLVVAFAGR